MSKRLQSELDASFRYLFYLNELLEAISFRCQFIKNRHLRRKASRQIDRAISSLENLREKMEQNPLCKSIPPPNREEYHNISQELAIFFGLTCLFGENRNPGLFLSFARNILTDITFQTSTKRYRRKGEETCKAGIEAKREIWLLHNYFPLIFSDSSEYRQFMACRRIAPQRKER